MPLRKGGAWRLPSHHISMPRRLFHILLLGIGAIILWFTFISDGMRWSAPHRESIAAAGFKPGTPKLAGATYSRTLVVPRLKNESTDWIESFFGTEDHMRLRVYVADDEEAEFHPPANKGHEVMIYLTYIIDHYSNLSDVNIFMHSQRYTWHNNGFQGTDAVHMVTTLSSERVQREGYMNLRCDWNPGCPGWMHPRVTKWDQWKPEQDKVAGEWNKLFPFDPVPKVLGQPCCSQFALSGDRIRSLPLARYVAWRDWLLTTTLTDDISGRVWEYFWQFVFTGHNVLCPQEHVCYCDGFGICFGGKKEYDKFLVKYREKTDAEGKLDKWKEQYGNLTEQIAEAKTEKMREQLLEELGRDKELEGKFERHKAYCDRKVDMAKERGTVAKNRAQEAGRRWREGDGF